MLETGRRMIELASGRNRTCFFFGSSFAAAATLELYMYSRNVCLTGISSIRKFPINLRFEKTDRRNWNIHLGQGFYGCSKPWKLFYYHSPAAEIMPTAAAAESGPLMLMLPYETHKWPPNVIPNVCKSSWGNNFSGKTLSLLYRHHDKMTATEWWLQPASQTDSLPSFSVSYLALLLQLRF